MHGIDDKMREKKRAEAEINFARGDCEPIFSFCSDFGSSPPGLTLPANDGHLAPNRENLSDSARRIDSTDTCAVADDVEIEPEPVASVRDLQSFHKALAALQVSRQRVLGALFIGHVLELTTNPMLRHFQEVASKADIMSEELTDAWYSVQALTHVRTPIMDYGLQSSHFVAEACMASLSPVWAVTKTNGIAEMAAIYCRTARICATVQKEQECSEFSSAEMALESEISEQYRITQEYLQ